MSKTETKPTATVTPTNVALKMNLRVSDKDFSEALSVTRTLHFDTISKTSIVESALACACATAKVFPVEKIAAFIVNNLSVADCFHKREENKAKDVIKSTILRIRHHVKDTVKTNHIADTLYSHDKETDTVIFTDKYVKICTEDLTYRKKVSALIKKVKANERTVVRKKEENDKKAVKKADSKKTDTAVSVKEQNAEIDDKKAVNA